ncbi:MAG: amino acid adenylation domain-containing protein, partial [Nitrococcus sp.]|nr:amino acid adenylation domain-containing protein [Nitrococcus sp.]
MTAPCSPHETFADCLRANARQWPARIAIRSLAERWNEERTLTYRELDRLADRAGRHLRQLAQPGERVVLLLPNGIDYAIAFLGCLYAGLIAVPAYPPETRSGGPHGRIGGILADCSPAVILTDAHSQAVVEALCDDSSITRRRIHLASEISALCHGAPPLVTPRGEDIAFLQYTSGSVSAPKGVMVSQHNLLANEAAIKAAFEIETDDVIVSWLPLFHDMGLIGGLLQPLFSGASLVLLSPRQFLEKPVRWLEAISRFGGTVSGGPDFAFRLCADRVSEEPLRGLDLSTWKLAFCGSEPIHPETHAKFATRFGPAGFDPRAQYACYGLAEATLLVTGSRKGRGLRQAPIGGNEIVSCGYIPQGHQLRILDSHGKRTDGVGEICLAGPSIAQGYWHNPAATAATFIELDGERILRTGDVGLLRDGELFVTGRLKDLIIVRGQNIYPQDIERAIESEIEAVRRGRVAAFPIQADGTESIGIAVEVSRAMQRVVSAEALIAAISEAVATACQEPAKLVLLLQPGALPKTSSGKLRRSQCLSLWVEGKLDVFAASGDPTPGKASHPRRVRDSLPLDEAITRAWAAVLEITSPRSEDHFFLSGGNSIRAVQLVARVREALAVEVELATLFDHPRLGDFAEAVAERVANGSASGKPQPQRQSLSATVLSHSQDRLWFLWHLEPLSAAYNIAGAVRLRGVLDEAALEGAFARLVARHETLRTTFESGADGAAIQRIHPASSASVAIARTDLSALAESDRQAEVRRLSAAEAEAPFDLEAGPLLRLRLLRCKADEHVLLVTLHHIVSDGWSMRVLVDEFTALYSALAEAREAQLAELPIQYADYAIWQRAWLEAGESERQLAYWKEKLGSEHPVLELPLDHPRKAQASYRGAQHVVEIDAALTKRLRALGQQRTATLFMVLLAAFKALLYRYSGQQDIRVGVPTANRTRVETEGLIGFFVNTQVLSTPLDGRLCFKELLARVKETVLGAQSHQDLPFEQLVEALQPQRSLNQNPLFQVMVNYLRQEESGEYLRRLRALEIESLPQSTQAPKFDLSLDLVEGAAVTCTFTYAADLFDAATIERLGRHWLTLLEAVTAEAGTSVADVPLLLPDEHAQLEAWSRGEAHALDGRCLHELIEERVRLHPDAIAVVYEDTQLTYGELNARANRLARHLRAKGVGPDVLVGLAVERSLEMVVGLLGILKAGGAYVPLDPSYPAERLAFMIEDAGVALILTQQRLLEQLPAGSAAVWCLDRDWHEVEGLEATDLPNLATPHNLAYCIYTSGSTGKPKGAGNSHAGIVNRLGWMQEAYGLSASDRILHKTPFSFDVSVWELFWPLLYGAALVVARPGAHRDPQALRETIIAQQVSIMHFVPSLLNAFVSADGEDSKLASLRNLMCSGEALSPELQRVFLERHGDVQLHNLYGPTEAAIDVSFWRCREESGASSVPIGHPIWNTQLMILDGDLNAVPAGVVGELYIG